MPSSSDSTQHESDIRAKIAALSAIRNPSRRQADELAEWKQALKDYHAKKSPKSEAQLQERRRRAKRIVQRLVDLPVL